MLNSKHVQAAVIKVEDKKTLIRINLCIALERELILL